MKLWEKIMNWYKTDKIMSILVKIEFVMFDTQIFSKVKWNLGQISKSYTDKNSVNCG